MKLTRRETYASLTAAIITPILGKIGYSGSITEDELDELIQNETDFQELQELKDKISVELYEEFDKKLTDFRKYLVYKVNEYLSANTHAYAHAIAKNNPEKAKEIWNTARDIAGSFVEDFPSENDPPYDTVVYRDETRENLKSYFMILLGAPVIELDQDHIDTIDYLIEMAFEYDVNNKTKFITKMLDEFDFGIPWKEI